MAKCSACGGTGTAPGKQNLVGDFPDGTSGKSSGIATKAASMMSKMGSKKKGK